jgi:hypothetical protein
MPQMSGFNPVLVPVTLCSGHSPSSWGLFDTVREGPSEEKVIQSVAALPLLATPSVGALCSCPLLPSRRVKGEHSRVSLGQSSERRDGGRA